VRPPANVYQSITTSHGQARQVDRVSSRQTEIEGIDGTATVLGKENSHREKKSRKGAGRPRNLAYWSREREEEDHPKKGDRLDRKGRGGPSEWDFVATFISREEDKRENFAPPCEGKRERSRKDLVRRLVTRKVPFERPLKRNPLICKCKNFVLLKIISSLAK